MIRKKKAAAKVTNAYLLKVLLQEIADVRFELKQDIVGLKQELGSRIERVEQKIDTLDQKFNVLNAKVDRNHEWCIRNIDGVDKRVRVLETIAAS